MKKITLLMCLLLFSSLITLAQDPRNGTFFLSSGFMGMSWHYDENLPWELNSESYPYNSIYNFTYGPDQYNGFVSVCDENAEPILVTDGTHIWFYDYDHYELISSELKAGLQSEAYLQNTIIIPKPGSYKQYYIVTLSGGDLGVGAGFGHNQGMYYSEVDANSGNITQLNIPLYPNIDGSYYAGSNKANALTSTVHSDGYNYWLVASSDYGVANILSSYLVTDQGIQLYSTSNLPIADSGIATSLKITRNETAPNLRRIACGSLNGDTFLGTFNCETGEIQQTEIPITGNLPQAYSVEFSANGNYLYCLTSGGDLYNIAINDTEIMVPDYPWIQSGNIYKSLQFYNNNNDYFSEILISRSPSYNSFLSSIRNTNTSSPVLQGYSINIWNTTTVPQPVVFQECELYCPTFNINYSVCQGGTINPLPTVSTEGIVGTWSPALNNTTTTVYTFTPNPGQCASERGITIFVSPILTPTFDPIAPICAEITLVLPTTSTNGIAGTWSPAVNNTVTTTYTFTPTAGLCANTTTMTVTVKPTPTFNDTAMISNGTINYTLPPTSANGIAGTWNPSTIAEGEQNYTFTPNTGQCPITKSFLLMKQTTIDAVDDDFSYSPIIEGIGFDQNGDYYTSSVFDNDSIIFENTVSVNNVNVSTDPNFNYPFVMMPDGRIKIHRGTPYGTYIMGYKITQNNCSEKYDTATATVYIPDPNGNSRKAAKTEQLSSNITVYPNPSKDIFNFDLTNGKGEYDTVTVYNILGAKLYENSLRGNSFNLIDLSDLATGCYIAKVSGNSGIASFQLIKQ